MSGPSKGIRLKSWEVRAILREIEAPGTGKTQTRQVIKLPRKSSSGGPIYEHPAMGGWEPTTIGGGGCFAIARDGTRQPVPEMVGIWHRTTGDCMSTDKQAGDLLWCRETFWQASRYPATLPGGEPEPLSWCWGNLFHYAADGSPPNCHNRHHGPGGLKGGAFAAPDPYAVWLKRASIHMPRRASRLTLEVTGVKVERLQDISEVDAIAEGVAQIAPPDKDGGRHFGVVPGLFDRPTAAKAYATLWDAINGPGAWDANPWVAAVTFCPHLLNIDDFIAGRASA